MTYWPHPTNGTTVQKSDMTHIRRIRKSAPAVFIGLADNPLTITLYRSNAIIQLVKIDTQPQSEPKVP